ncbi:MAG: hypothetical protein JW987_02520 [Anaerolineaceae bacterium]|nr:hypothetical protein [Anaerolineaceae bacterium]
MDSSAEFVPRDMFVTALRRWWVIALAVLVGGLAGLGFHALRPTVFEARFDVLLGLDQVGSGELERFEEDAALDAAGLILGGPDTIRQVAEVARQEGLNVQPEDLARMASLERRRSTWMVRLRGTDAQQLEALASVWLRTGFSALEQAYEHALRADSASRTLASLEACLARTAHSSPAEGLCGAGNLVELQAEIQRTGELLAQEQQGARGLVSFVLVGSAEKAVVPAQAVANGRGALALAGALIGLALGMWVSQIAAPRKQER